MNKPQDQKPQQLLVQSWSLITLTVDSSIIDIDSNITDIIIRKVIHVKDEKYDT